MEDSRSQGDRSLVTLSRVGRSVISIDGVEDTILPEDVTLERRLSTDCVVNYLQTDLKQKIYCLFES